MVVSATITAANPEVEPGSGYYRARGDHDRGRRVVDYRRRRDRDVDGGRGDHDGGGLDVDGGWNRKTDADADVDSGVRDGRTCHEQPGDQKHLFHTTNSTQPRPVTSKRGLIFSTFMVEYASAGSVY